ncbi:SPW repeat protein [Actinosynnema sp. NPDC050436]|uniref:SPW repeat protein n=1 Tax=Actinosynnema sp. NPDC050436 TaxID=3155659 RepID=UPI00340E3274
MLNAAAKSPWVITGSAEPTSSTLVVVVLLGALTLVLGLVRLLRRVLGLLTRVLLSAGAALMGLASVLAGCTVLTTLVLVYIR